MKTRFIILILFLACQALYAQTTTGISVQGIARDANKAALAAQSLSFIFTVSGTPSGGSPTVYYKETQDITTDAFGVFSHIIGTGTPSSGTFTDVPFGKAHMSLKVEVGGVVLLDGPFQYAPYAKNADNGVPVGGVIMWSGTIGNIPAGWALCDGGNGTPDLRGRFIVGYNASDNDYNAIGDTGGEKTHTLTANEMPAHNHNASTGAAGDHGHTITIYSYEAAGVGTSNVGVVEGVTYKGERSDRAWTNTTGSHTHTVTIDNAGGGQAHENRPPYFALAYIMRLK
jgi:microcystin-dependent protein